MAATNNWVYRASDEEHEVILEAVRRGPYSSVASFVREACLRLAYEDDLDPMFSKVQDLNDELEHWVKTFKARSRDEQEAAETSS